MQPAISIVVNAYNRETYIRECLDSVVSQKVSKEVLCIDDGSTDRTASILDEYAQRYPEVRVIRNATNNGLVFSRCRGMELSSGRWMLFVDADDRLLPDALEPLVAQATATSVDIFEFSVQTDGDTSFCQSLQHRPTRVLDESPWSAYCKGDLTNSLINKLFSQDVYTKAVRTLDATSPHTNYSDVVYFLWHLTHHARHAAVSATEGYFYYAKRGMVHNLDKVSRLKQYCGFKETARLLLGQFQDYAAIEKTYLAVCMQAVNQFLELPAIEQPDYRHLLDEMMSKALADELIAKRVEELGGVPAVILKKSDGSRLAVPCIQTIIPV